MSEKFTIILDAGHGGTELIDGSTPNNAIAANGLLEKNLTLEIARRAAAKLYANNFRVLLTRDDDRNLSFAERAGKSRTEGADAFVSLHFNANPNTAIDRTEVYVANASDNSDYALANRLAANVSAAAMTSAAMYKADFTILKSDFHLAKTAACLLEIAYLSNPNQAAKLLSTDYLEHLSTAVAKSVVEFASEKSFAQSLGEEASEKLIYETTKEHADPKNTLIDLPEPGKGTDRISISIPPNLKLSRWEIEVTAQSTGAGYKVAKLPKTNAETATEIAIEWWHLPYGKISYTFKAYASPDGKTAATERIVYDKAGWMEKAKDQIAQGVPMQFAVKGDKAKLIYEAIQKYQASQKGKQAGDAGVAIAMEPITITVVVLVGLVIFGILVALGLITLAAIIKMALDKGYNVKDTKYKAAVGEGATRQDHEIAFNITKPENAAATSPAQSFPLGLDDDLHAGYFLPLDAIALGGEPVFDITKSVGSSGANLSEDVFAVKKRLIQLGFDWLTLDKKIDAATITAIKLFQTIISGKNSISGDGKIEVGKNTYSWLQAENAPQWQTMPAGSQTEGFYNYELNDTKDTHDFGTDWMADTIRSAAAHYRDNYLKTHSSAALFIVNDVSLPRGGNTPDHGGHEAGLACDLQLPRTDGKGGGITYRDKIYDQAAARGVLQALKAQSNVTNIYFNDPTLTAEGLCQRENSWCEAVKMYCHDNHIHFEIKPPTLGAVERKPIPNYRSGNRLYQGSYQDDIDYQTHALDASCSNSKGIAARRMFVEYADMKTKSDLPNKDQNVCLSWNDIPANACEIDVVVHFHGYNITQEKEFFNYVDDISGLKLGKRRRPTIGILPFGQYFTMKGSTDIGYRFPFLTDKNNGLQQLINFALNEFAERNKLSVEDLKVGRLILTAHSGGGAAVAQILSIRKYSIAEIHLFDAIYGCRKIETREADEGCQYRPINEWAAARIKADEKLSEAEMPTKGGALRVIYKGTTLSEKTLPNRSKLSATLSQFYKVEKTDCDHNLIPKDFGPALLEKANAVLDVNKCNPKPKAATKSLAYYDEDEIDYFAQSETNFTNY